MITVKELQNSVCHSGTQCCWQQLVQELITNIPVLKPAFLLEQKFNSQNFENSHFPYYRKYEKNKQTALQ